MAPFFFRQNAIGEASSQVFSSTKENCTPNQRLELGWIWTQLEGVVIRWLFWALWLKITPKNDKNIADLVMYIVSQDASSNIILALGENMATFQSFWYMFISSIRQIPPIFIHFFCERSYRDLSGKKKSDPQKDLQKAIWINDMLWLGWWCLCFGI